VEISATKLEKKLQEIKHEGQANSDFDKTELGRKTPKEVLEELNLLRQKLTKLKYAFWHL